MKAQQVIYTSCKRGIEGSSSGFQNYSYSPQIKEWISRGNRIGDLQTYSTPRIDGLPSLPTKEQAQELYPRRQVFGRLGGGDDLYGMALCSYIGRDYPEGSVRGGNFISHALILPALQLDAYPCEYIDSPSFRRWMDAEEARGDQPPAALPPIDVEKNPSITVDEVRAFLEDEDNADVFDQMLHCLLLRREEGITRKLLINDSEDNFALWVAALEMALPVRQSLDFGFSFYEYDPTITNADVLRTVEGMTYDLHDPTLSYNYIFDFATGDFAEPADEDADVDEFCEFAVTALRYAPESLAAFHQYLDQTSYSAADAGVGAAYTLCQINAGLISLSDMDDERLSRLYGFLTQYGSSAQRRALFDKTAEAMQTMLFEPSTQQVLHECLAKLTQSDALLSAAPEILLELMISLFTTSGVEETLYAQARDLASGTFQALGRNADVELFQAVTADANANLGLDSTGTVPWTVRAYADLASRALLSTLSSGVRLPVGTSADQMLATLGKDNANAVSKLVSCIVRHHDPRAGIAIFETLESQWQTQPSLTIMLSLLVLQAKPSSEEIRNTAISRLWNLFLSGDEATRVACCQSLIASGLQDVAYDHLEALAGRSTQEPERYYDFLSTLMGQLPQRFLSGYAPKLESLCWRIKRPTLSGSIAALRIMLAMPGLTKPQVIVWLNEMEATVPIVKLTDADRRAVAEYKRLYRQIGRRLGDRGMLANHLLRVEQLTQALSARRPDAVAVNSLQATVSSQGATLPMQAAGAQANEYVASLADLIAEVVDYDSQTLRLQVTALPPAYMPQLVAIVLRAVIGSRDVRRCLTIIAIDANLQLLAACKAEVVSIESLAQAAANFLSDSNVKLTSLDKIMTHEGRREKFTQQFEQAYGRPDWDRFNECYELIANQLEKKEADKKPGFLKLFKR